MGMRSQSPAPVSLSSLIIDIEQSHHAFTRTQLERAEALFDKIERARLPKNLRQYFQALKDDLLQHLMKEERILFPYITALESNPGHPPSSCFGSVANPIRTMQIEHDAVKLLLAKIRKVTMSYQPEQGVSAGLAELYAALKALDDDLIEHMQQEDDVLFPRALRLERG